MRGASYRRLGVWSRLQPLVMCCCCRRCTIKEKASSELVCNRTLRLSRSHQGPITISPPICGMSCYELLSWSVKKCLLPTSSTLSNVMSLIFILFVAGVLYVRRCSHGIVAGAMTSDVPLRRCQLLYPPPPLAGQDSHHCDTVAVIKKEISMSIGTRCHAILRDPGHACGHSCAVPD